MQPSTQLCAGHMKSPPMMMTMVMMMVMTMMVVDALMISCLDERLIKNFFFPKSNV